MLKQASKPLRICHLFVVFQPMEPVPSAQLPRAFGHMRVSHKLQVRNAVAGNVRRNKLRSVLIISLERIAVQELVVRSAKKLNFFFSSTLLHLSLSLCVCVFLLVTHCNHQHYFCNCHLRFTYALQSSPRPRPRHLSDLPWEPCLPLCSLSALSLSHLVNYVPEELNTLLLAHARDHITQDLSPLPPSHEPPHVQI